MTPPSCHPWPCKLRQIAPKSSGDQLAASESVTVDQQQHHLCGGAFSLKPDPRLSTDAERERRRLPGSHISLSASIPLSNNPQPLHAKGGAQSYPWVPPSTIVPRPATLAVPRPATLEVPRPATLAAARLPMSVILLEQYTLIKKLERRVAALENKMTVGQFLTLYPVLPLTRLKSGTEPGCDHGSCAKGTLDRIVSFRISCFRFCL